MSVSTRHVQTPLTARLDGWACLDWTEGFILNDMKEPRQRGGKKK